jgi:hypothetical protein
VIILCKIISETLIKKRGIWIMGKKVISGQNKKAKEEMGITADEKAGIQEMVKAQSGVILHSGLSKGGKQYYITVLPVKDMKIDSTYYSDEENIYNRPVNDCRVKDIAKNYDESLVGIIILSIREDGNYFIVNGQHRKLGIEKAGGTHSLCQVFIGLTLQEEAEMYKKLSDTTKAIPAINSFKAKLVLKDEASLSIMRIVKSLGLEIYFKGKSPAKKRILAVTSLESLYRSFSNTKTTVEEINTYFKRCLYIITQSWGGNPRSYDQRMLNSFRVFMKQYKDDINDKTLIRRLKTVDPEYIFSSGKRGESSSGGNRYIPYAYELMILYNYRLHQEKRLDVDKLLRERAKSQNKEIKK